MPIPKKDKYLQIFNYLLEFSKPRSRPVRDIENAEIQYPEIVWFADIPQCEFFDCVTFQTYKQDSDYWLKINKPKGEEPYPPTFPKLSESLAEWIVEGSLTNENGKPTLRESITKNGGTILLADQTQVQTEFKSYLDNKWIADSQLYKKEFETYKAKLAEYEKQNQVYKSIFSIYNKSHQFSEEFELIIGVGLLCLQENANSLRICRHILTSKVEIFFETSQRISSLIIKPATENDIQIETDAILDLTNHFEPTNIIEAEKRVIEFLKEKNVSTNPFANQIKEALQIFADRVRTDGQSNDGLTKPTALPKRPTVYFAPALILRKRNARSFSALYEKIIQYINNADESLNISSINDVIGYQQQPADFSDGLKSETSALFRDETIYFPKKYNDEQVEIIEKARLHNKVLVQGPPGTGKSHTIANLICHLLANGNTILVTAYTKRALEVLKGLLPDDFKKMAVSLLGSDSSSISDLSVSVNAINEKLSDITNFNNFEGLITEQETELNSIREKKAYRKNEWLKIKEKSTRKQNINCNYSGTLTEIAEKIDKESSAFSWFKDEINNINIVELIGDIEKFASLSNYYQTIDCSIFNSTIPSKERIFTLSELEEYQRISNLLRQYVAKGQHSSITCKDYLELRKQLERLRKLYLEIKKCELPFKSELVEDYLKHPTVWDDKLARTNDLLAALLDKDLKDFDKNVQIEYPKNKGLKQLKNDAKTLLAHMKAGNPLSGPLFNLRKGLLPKDIKEKLYFVDSVKVNRSACDTVAEFKTVLADIDLKQTFAELETIWEIKSNTKSYSGRAKFYEKLQKDTEKFIVNLKEASEIKVLIEADSSLRIANCDSEEIKQLIDLTDYNAMLSQLETYKRKTANVKQELSVPNMHPVASSIIEETENININKYKQCLEKVDSLNSQREQYRYYGNLQKDLSQHFPILVSDILQNAFDSSNLSQLKNAIFHKHALTEITRLLDEDYGLRLLDELSDLERREERLIAKIAANKAWLQIVERLRDNPQLQQHLIAWKSVRIPKTKTSPNYYHKKEVANREMEFCKKSIACWIMPLYQVVENFIPEPGLFDYVIVDEASQLGPDAIFLLYISKKIIVVGDDKQTAPEYVGVDDSVVRTLIQKHLKPNPNQEIPFADLYGTDHSFFDHCDLLCAGKRIVLREHFRCMPEIIEFSNKYFYAPDGKGLYPLKQFSDINRLEPLKTFYCQNGHVEGSYQNIVNRVEAEEIAKKISEIIKDDNYYKIEDGVKKPKTIGVIALQGNAQAKLIENKLMDLIGGEEIENRKIICGNSASFQGGERDVMFLSMITGQGHRRTALARPEDERRFNVAASRAKEQVWLFHSVQLEDLHSATQGVVDLRYKLLDHFLNYKEKLVVSYNKVERRMGNQPSPFESWFEVDVYNDIIAQGYGVIPQYEVAKGKYRIDLVIVLPNGVKIAVECDGEEFHGPEQLWADIGRKRFLERIGWQVFTVREIEYYLNRKKALEPLWKLISFNSIQKDEPKTSNSYQQNERPETEKDTVEPRKPEVNIKTKPNNSNIAKQTELLDKETQTVISSTDEKPIHSETNIKVSGDLNVAEILIYTSLGNVYKVQKREINDLFNTGQTNTVESRSLQALGKIDFEPNEKPIYLTGTNDYSGYLIVAFENGKIGKIPMHSYHTEYNRKKLKNGFNTESKLIFIEKIEDDIDLVALSSINKVVVFNTRQVNAVESRIAKGVQVIKSKHDSLMVKVAKLNQVKLSEPEYYRKGGNLNLVGYYLKPGDEI